MEPFQHFPQKDNERRSERQGNDLRSAKEMRLLNLLDGRIMQIVSLGHNLPEMSNPIFRENIINLLSAEFGHITKWQCNRVLLIVA